MNSTMQESQSAENRVEDVGFTIVILSNDFAHAVERFCSIVNKKATSTTADEETVLDAAKESASRCQILSSEINKFCNCTSGRPGSLPQRLSKAQKRLVELVEAVKRAFFNPYDIQANQQVPVCTEKLSKNVAKLLIAVKNAASLQTASPRSPTTAGPSSRQQQARIIAKNCGESFKGVISAVSTRNQAQYINAIRCFVSAFNAAVSFSETNSLALESRLKSVAMQVGVLSKTAFLNPADSTHQQQFAQISKDVSHVIMSILDSSDTQTEQIEVPEISTEESSAPMKIGSKPKSASQPKIQITKRPVAQEIIDVLISSFPIFKAEWRSSVDSGKSEKIIETINAVIKSHGNSFPSPPPSPGLQPTHPPPSPTTDGPRLPAAVRTQQRISSNVSLPRSARSLSNPPQPSNTAAEKEQQPQIAQLKAISTMATLRGMSSPRSPHYSDPSSRIGSPIVHQNASLVDLLESSVSSIEEIKVFANCVLTNKQKEPQPNTIASVKLSLAELVEGLTRQCVRIIPHCRVVDKGFASKKSQSPPLSNGDYGGDFDGRPTTVTKCEFLSVTLLERALKNAKKVITADLQPLHPEASIIAVAASSTYDSHRVMSVITQTMKTKLMKSEILLCFLKRTVSQLSVDDDVDVDDGGGGGGENYYDNKDIQGVFSICVEGISTAMKLASIVTSFAISAETLRCIEDSKQRNFDEIEAELSLVGQKQLEEQQRREKLPPIWKETTLAILEDVSGTIRAGTLNHIVEKVTSDQSYNNQFLHTVITTYKSFCSPKELFDKLVERYNVPPGMVAFNRVNAIRLKVGIVLKHWIENQLGDFDDSLLNDLQKLLDVMRKEGHEHLVGTLLEEIRKQKMEDNLNQKKIEIQKLPKEIQGIIDSSCIEMFEESNEVDIAKQLTLIDAGLFLQIKPSELLNQNWNKKATKQTESPSVLAIIARSNSVSLWAATMTLSQLTVSQRSKVVTKFILIADQMRKLNNFNGLMSIIAGLTVSSVARLAHTFSTIKAPHIAIFEQLQDLMNPTGSFKKYREALSQCSGFTLPYLGTYLSDLTFMEDGNPDLVPSGSSVGSAKLINVKKRELIYGVISQLFMHVQGKLDIAIEEPLHTVLSALPNLTDDVLYDISVQLEPRNCHRADLI